MPSPPNNPCSNFDHEELGRFICAFDEFTEQEKSALRAHLTKCRPCLEHYLFRLWANQAKWRELAERSANDVRAQMPRGH